MLALIYLCGFFGLFVCFGVSLMTKMHSLVNVESDVGKPCYIQSPMTWWLDDLILRWCHWTVSHHHISRNIYGSSSVFMLWHWFTWNLDQLKHTNMFLFVCLFICFLSFTDLLLWENKSNQEEGIQVQTSQKKIMLSSSKMAVFHWVGTRVPAEGPYLSELVWFKVVKLTFRIKYDLSYNA